MNTFSITKQGQEITFTSAHTLADAIAYIKENLSGNSFAMNLATARKLSFKQESWIQYLVVEAIKASQQVATEGDYLALVEQMNAGVKSAARKFKVRLPGDIQLSTVNRGQNIGCVYVYENDTYLTKIDKLGNLCGKVSEDVVNMLLDANDNLLKLAQLYGHETGNCSVCGRGLTDSLSVQMGIGPVCAKRMAA